MIKKLFRRILRLGRKLTSFSLIGILVYIFGQSILFYMVEHGIPEVAAYAIQALASIGLNFIFNNTLTWGDRRKTPMKLKLRKLTIAKMVTFLSGQFFFILLTVLIGVHYIVAYNVNILFIGIVNYFGNEFYIFNDRIPWYVFRRLPSLVPWLEEQELDE